MRCLAICALSAAACGGGHGSRSDAGLGSDADQGDAGTGDAGIGDAGIGDAGIGSDAASGPSGLVYLDPTGGALRLVQRAGSTPSAILLDFVVGSAPLTGFSTGFDLPLAPDQVTLGPFTPGRALDPGTAPAAARAIIGTQGPLRGMLVVGQSQKAGGNGAVAGDTTLTPGAVLYTIELDLAVPAHPGVVFDGTVSGFALPSGGLRNKVGLTVVDTGDVKIGRLEVR